MHSCAPVTFCTAEPWEILIAVNEGIVHGTVWSWPRWWLKADISDKHRHLWQMQAEDPASVMLWTSCGTRCSATAVSNYSGRNNIVRNVLGFCGCPRLMHDVVSGARGKFTLIHIVVLKKGRPVKFLNYGCEMSNFPEDRERIKWKDAKKSVWHS